MAHNSTIKVNNHCQCKPDCPLWKTPGFGKFNYNHASEEIKIAAGEKAKRTYQNRLQRQKKSTLSRKLHEADKMVKEGENGQETAVITPQRQWFLDRRVEMTNVCIECGSSTRKAHDDFFWRICHIVPKSLVPSVALNENNWVELCWLHHQEFDNTFDKAAAMQCFPEIKQKFQLFKHLIPPHEMRKVNPHLLK